MMKKKTQTNSDFLDLSTLIVYTIMAMAAAVALIAFAALLTDSDISMWNPVAVVSAFFILTGCISGWFILKR